MTLGVGTFRCLFALASAVAAAIFAETVNEGPVVVPGFLRVEAVVVAFRFAAVLLGPFALALALVLDLAVAFGFALTLGFAFAFGFGFAFGFRVVVPAVFAAAAGFLVAFAASLLGLIVSLAEAALPGMARGYDQVTCKGTMQEQSHSLCQIFFFVKKNQKYIIILK